MAPGIDRQGPSPKAFPHLPSWPQVEAGSGRGRGSSFGHVKHEPLDRMRPPQARSPARGKKALKHGTVRAKPGQGTGLG